MDFQRFNQMKSMMAEEFFLSYSGLVSEGILEAVGRTLRERMGEINSQPKQARQVFSVFVELMQNIIQYGDEGPQYTKHSGEKPSYGMLTVSKEGERLVVISGNYIAEDEAEKMQQRVGELEGCSQEELRQIYKEKLQEPAEENSKGGSLGLIEIARRTSQPLECLITEAPKGAKGMAFFIIKAVV